MLKTLLRIVCVLLLGMTSSLQGFSQVNTASLTGLVTDASGAAVIGASVKARNNATNVEQSVTSDSSGYYTSDAVRIEVCFLIGARKAGVQRTDFSRVVQYKTPVVGAQSTTRPESVL